MAEDAERLDDEYAHESPSLARDGDQATAVANRGHARERLSSEYSAVAVSIAHRFAGRGANVHELTRVAMRGLSDALDRFDASNGKDFRPLAVSTITGELGRHRQAPGGVEYAAQCRDDLLAQLDMATVELCGELGRAPTVGELAARLDGDIEEICDVYQHGVDATDMPGGESVCRLDATDRTCYLPTLSERDDTVLRLRIHAGLSQTQIANLLGTTQRQILRILATSLRTIRTHRPTRADDPMVTVRNFNAR